MLQIDGVGTYDFSENNAKECPWHDPSCGGSNAWEMAGWLSESGTVQESCDPYVANDVSCKTTCPYVKTLLDWRYISQDTPDTEVLKGYIQTYGPVYISMYAGDDSDPLWHQEFSDYDGSYTLYYDGMVDRTNHGVLIVGWDDSLTHAGGTGGWIVKNSWGTDWGGTCGYGAEGGYFTIGYGSHTFARSPSFVYDWEDYDPDDGILYYNEVGMTNGVGYGTTTAWGLSKFIPSRDTYVDRVEFYTLDETTDVDVYLYDDFDGTTLDNLLWSSLDHSFDEAGYHGVTVVPPLAMTDNDDIVAVVRFTNTSYEFPIAVDDQGPHETQRTYTSPNGSTWYDEADYGDDVAIRLRTSEEVGNAPPNRPSNPSPVDGATGVSTNADLSWTGGDPDAGDTVTYDVYLEVPGTTLYNLACEDLEETSCDPGKLDADTRYTWYVEATDSHDATTTGDTWDFTTQEEAECSILFDASHDTTGYETIDDMYADFAEVVRAEGYGVDQLTTGPITSGSLSRYCALVLVQPETAFTSNEVSAIQDFVEGGGGLFVLGECCDWEGTSTHLNEVVGPMGIHIDGDVLFDDTENHDGYSGWPLIHEFASHQVTGGLEEVWHVYGASLDVQAPAYGLGWGDDDSYTRGGHTLESSWATTMPVIDGHISAGEWSEATRVDLRAPAEASTVMMYLKNDGEKLYLAFDDSNDTTFSPGNYDQIGIYFDDEPTGARDGAWTYDACPSGEGNFWVGAFDPDPSTAFRGMASGPELCDPVEPAAGVNGKTSATSGHVQHEVAMGLSASELRGSPGDEVGMRFYVRDYDTDSWNGYWPYDAVWDDPSTYGDLRLATQGDVGRPVVMAAAPYGSGRVVAISDNWLLSSNDADEDGTADIYQYDAERLAKNVVEWICRCGEAPNTPPDAPSDPSPADGATDVSTDADLSWTGGDADPGDTVTYDVYFEAEDSAPDELECDDAPEPSCDPGALSEDTDYYWYVVAGDDNGGITTSETWHFTTAEPANDPPTISGLPDQELPMNGSADDAIDLWMYADDAEDTDDALSFTISNAPAAEAGVSIDGNRYLDFNPAADWTGTTRVEIQVEDTGGLTDVDSFQVTVTGGTVYLPLVVKRYPPLPDVPVLNAISDPEGDGNYTVSWGDAYLADEYVLQEDDNQGFSSPTERYSGTRLWWDASGKAPGTYHYRVKAINEWGDSGWSNPESVTVAMPEPDPCPSDTIEYSGTTDQNRPVRICVDPGFSAVKRVMINYSISCSTPNYGASTVWDVSPSDGWPIEGRAFDGEARFMFDLDGTFTSDLKAVSGTWQGIEARCEGFSCWEVCRGPIGEWNATRQP
jgi:hypothetical protein